MSQPTIYTMGYAGWAPEALRDYVLALDATLVDVRIAPTSKSPQWRRDALRTLLGERYRHMAALGNRNAFTGSPAELNDPGSAVAPIAALLTRGPVILLCGCADPMHCHRSLAADYLAERLNAAVAHIAAPERTKRPDQQMRLPGLD